MGLIKWYRYSNGDKSGGNLPPRSHLVVQQGITHKAQKCEILRFDHD